MVYFVIMALVSLVFTIMGICMWRSKEPVNFWTGQEVKKEEITDVKAYNKANGQMWLGFAALMWIDAFAGLFGGGMVGGITLCVTMAVGIPMLPVTYNLIYKKYGRK